MNSYKWKPRLCENCKDTYSPHSGRDRYCSVKCGNKSIDSNPSSNAGEYRLHMKPCIECRRFCLGLFCSEHCRVEHIKKLQAIARPMYTHVDIQVTPFLPLEFNSLAASYKSRSRLNKRAQKLPRAFMEARAVDVQRAIERVKNDETVNNVSFNPLLLRLIG